jgi:hypothetical protein
MAADDWRIAVDLSRPDAELIRNPARDAKRLEFLEGRGRLRLRRNSAGYFLCS